MKYKSEFEIVETINSRVTKLQHRYILLYHVELSMEKEESYLRIWDMRANHPVGGRRMKSTNYQQNKLELAYVLYTTTGIHPLHLFFFHDTPREMWKGYVLAKGHEEKPYKRVEWYDLLHPLPLYPNLEGFCHTKEFIDSCAINRVPQTAFGDEIQFSLEWTLASLERYQGKVPKHNPEGEDILVTTGNAFVKEKRKLEVV